MNYKQHAENSAAIFGGSVTDYLPIHMLVDSNKIASASVLSRFFLHHYDVGSLILEKIFGEEVSGVPVKKVLLQHLIEDYGQVPVLSDWLENGGTIPIRYSGEGYTSEYMQARLREAGYDISLEHLEVIESLLTLRFFTDDEKILHRSESSMHCAVFGHATGIYLAEKFLPQNMGDAFTLDVLTAYYNARFKGVPTLSDYVTDWIQKKDWMYAPTSLDRYDPEKVKNMIEHTLAKGVFGIKNHFKLDDEDVFNQYKCRDEYID